MPPLKVSEAKEIMEATYSRADVSTHKSVDDLWVIVANNVYDLSEFQFKHPGGAKSKKLQTVPTRVTLPTADHFST
jgi:cytochrome b involved in lipid metabolism